jgi:hypothetical protein
MQSVYLPPLRILVFIVLHANIKKAGGQVANRGAISSALAGRAHSCSLGNSRPIERRARSSDNFGAESFLRLPVTLPCPTLAIVGQDAIALTLNFTLSDRPILRRGKKFIPID